MYIIELLKFHLKLKNEQWITITDNSMNPTLHSRNQIKITCAATYDKGDIVVFKRNRHLVIHRIVYISENVIWFKGDNNTYLDDDSRTDCIIGKAKGRTLVSSIIASMSYNETKKNKTKLHRLLFRCLCNVEHFQRIIAHNLKEK